MDSRTVFPPRCIDSPRGARVLRGAARVLVLGVAVGLAPMAGALWGKKDEAAREGVEVGKQSRMAELVPAERIEAAARQQ